MKFHLKSIYFFSSTVIIFWICFTGCGYHFRDQSEMAGLQIQSIAIPLMPSPSSEANFEADFTKMVREEFIQHAKVPLVSVEEAQMVLNGKIISLETEPVTYNQQKQMVTGHEATYMVTSSRRLRLKMEVSLLDRSSGKTVWENKSLEAKADFQVTSDPLLNHYYQLQALQAIAQDLARRIYQQTVERF
jgi:outer membrane lipopolysaccharide assembly protein LptE/RlpB